MCVPGPPPTILVCKFPVDQRLLSGLLGPAHTGAKEDCEPVVKPLVA